MFLAEVLEDPAFDALLIQVPAPPISNPGDDAIDEYMQDYERPGNSG
jgi:hypothetical protein